MKKRAVRGRIMTYLMRGVLILIAPAITVYVASFVLTLVDTWFGGITAALARLILPAAWLTGPFAGGYVPGLSLLFFVLLLLALGWLGSLPCGKQGLKLVDLLFQAIPGLRAIYTFINKMVQVLFGSQQTRRAVFIKVLGSDIRALAFVTKEVTDKTDGRKWLIVFLAHAPNTTSGLPLWVPEDETVDPEISPEESATTILSIGTMAPDVMRITAPQPVAGATPGASSQSATAAPLASTPDAITDSGDASSPKPEA